jgi:hypothetical protein
MNNIKFVSIETPYNSIYPWKVIRNIQYAIQANKHATLSKKYATWVPHLCNTQFVILGMNGYIGDSIGSYFLKLFPNSSYGIGREKTLEITNNIRGKKIDKILVYDDFGISSGMQTAIDIAEKNDIPIEYRKLPKNMLKNVFGQSFQSTFIPITFFSCNITLSCYGLFNILKKIRV